MPSLFEKNRVYKKDAFEFLEMVPEQSVDLAIVDPPYNMGKADWDTFPSQDEFLSFTYRWIDALIPAMKKSGSVYIFNTPFNSAYILQHLVSRGLLFQNWITWDKRDGLNSSRKRFTHGQETILFFSMSKNHTFNADAVRVPYESQERIEAAKSTGILKNGKRWFPNPDGRLCGEVWHISSERHKTKQQGKIIKTEHITPKPAEIIDRIIRASSNEKDLILDCFMGSGTTAVSAKKLGRNFTGAEINPTYVNLANKRLKEL